MNCIAFVGLALCFSLAACGGPAATPTVVPTVIPLDLPTQVVPTQGPQPGDPGYPIQVAPSVTPFPDGYPMPTIAPTLNPYPEPGEGGQGAPSGAVAEVGVPFQLEIGNSVTINPSGVGIRFDAVVEDTRCPANATCVQQGSAVVTIAIGDVTGFVDTITLATDGDLQGRASTSLTSIGLLRLVALDPYPGTYQDTAPPPAFVTLVIEP